MSILLFRLIPLLLLVMFSGLLALWAVILKTSDRGLERYSTIANALLSSCYLIWIVALTWYQGNAPILKKERDVVFRETKESMVLQPAHASEGVGLDHLSGKRCGKWPRKAQEG